MSLLTCGCPSQLPERRAGRRLAKVTAQGFVVAIKIQSNIPIPTSTIGNRSELMSDLRELSQAQIGDSAFFEKPEDTTIQKWRSKISSSITHIGSGWATYSKTPEQVDGVEVEGIRVWKKADVASK